MMTCASTARSVLALAAYLEDHPNAAAVCPFFNAPQVRPLPTPAHPDPPLQTPQPAAGDEISAECVTGAAIMVRAVFLRSMGHIDERYGNYGSEIEICAQVRSSGRKIVVLARVPAATRGRRLARSGPLSRRRPDRRHFGLPEQASRLGRRPVLSPENRRSKP